MSDDILLVILVLASPAIAFGIYLLASGRPIVWSSVAGGLRKPREESNAGRMAQAEEAANAWSLVAPYFDAVRSDYMAGLQALAVKPMSDNVRAGIEKLAVAVKVLDEVKSQVAGTITDGKVATHEAERTSRIAKLTTEQRRWTAW